MLIVPGEPGHLMAMVSHSDPLLRLPLSKPSYLVIQAQVVVSEVYALFEAVTDEAPFALGGGAELPTGELDIWFVVRPGGLKPSLLLAMVRVTKAILDRRQLAVTYVASGNAAGERLVRLCGFEKAAGRIGSYEEWRRNP